jgi:hypothetical protein
MNGAELNGGAGFTAAIEFTSRSGLVEIAGIVHRAAG